MFSHVGMIEDKHLSRSLKCFIIMGPEVSEELTQGSHRLEKYLNLEDFLEKSLKIKSPWESTGKSLKILEKSLNSTIFCRTLALLIETKISI